MSVILASQSPRRQELLRRMGLDQFEIRPAQGEEVVPGGLTVAQQVEELSRQKAREVAACARPGDVVIAADTVVAVDDRVLGKPKSPEQAEEMLRSLSGRGHWVYTGVTVCRDGVERTEHERTRVNFRALSPQEIRAYVQSGECNDKAGAYGIQGRGCVLVEGIEGDYYNVVGLPVCRLALMLREFGVDVMK